MLAEPGVAINSAGTSALSSVLLTKKVSSREVFHSTVEGGKGESNKPGSMYPVPFTWSTNGRPAAIDEAGEMEVIPGGPRSSAGSPSGGTDIKASARKNALQVRILG